MKKHLLMAMLFLFMAAIYYLVYSSFNAPTALCWDGILSFSKHRNGTCSYHGGVKEWKR